jgi:hypothetical protein
LRGEIEWSSLGKLRLGRIFKRAKQCQPRKSRIFKGENGEDGFNRGIEHQKERQRFTSQQLKGVGKNGLEMERDGLPNALLLSQIPSPPFAASVFFKM